MSALPKTARAAVMVKARTIEIREFPVGEPKAGQILVRVRRANICGSDLHMFRGESFGPNGLPFSFVMGHEVMGEVVALGEGRARDGRGQTLREGDLVTFAYYRACGACPECTRGREYACFYSLMSVVVDAEKPPHFTGAFGEYYYVRAGQRVFKIPPGVPDQLVAGCNCALAQVFQGLRTAGVGFGDKVVIQGAGGLGLYAVAVAKRMGASQVIVIDTIAARLELAKEFGADAVISLRSEPDPKQRTAHVKELTGGGASLCVEVVGRAEALNEGIRMLARGGRYLIMGSVVPRDTFKADPSLWIGENLTLYGVSLYGAEALSSAIDFVHEQKDRLPMHKMFAQTFPLAEVSRAFEVADALSNQETTAVRVQLVMAGG